MTGTGVPELDRAVVAHPPLFRIPNTEPIGRTVWRTDTGVRPTRRSHRLTPTTVDKSVGGEGAVPELTDGIVAPTPDRSVVDERTGCDRHPR